MNPGVVAQYEWPLALGLGGLAGFAIALLLLRRLGVVPVLPWSFSRAAAPPDDAALHAVLLVLLAVLLIAGALPFFGAAFVYRWFQSPRVAGLVALALLPLAAPALLAWRAPQPQASETPPAPLPRKAASLALLAAATVTFATLALGYRDPSAPVLLLAASAGFVLVALLIGATGLPSAAVAERAARLAGAALWSVCGAAVLLALLAVATTAQTLDVVLIGRAQVNTVWYVLGQPAAALAFLAAAALAANAAARAAVLGTPDRLRRFAEAAAALALGALFAVAFLAGGAGPGLPPGAWLAVKALLAALLVAALARAARDRPVAAATRLGWLVAALALANVVITALVLARRAAGDQ